MAATARDYYQELGVPREATVQEIKKAYQRLAKKWHPDVNKSPDAEERFKRINAAYETLSSEDNRRAYDEELRYKSSGSPSGFGGGGGRSAGGMSGGSPFDGEWSYMSGSSLDEEGLDELLDSLFGSRRRSGFDFSGTAGTGAGRFSGGGSSGIQARLDITLEEAYRGGRVHVQAGGRSMEVTIPARAADGTVVTVPGAAGAADGLALELRIKPHSFFEADGADLRATLRIAPWQAALGGSARVQLPDGSMIKLRIPAGIAAGYSLRLSGKGLTRPDGGRGDILLRMELTLPERLTDAERELYRKLAGQSRFEANLKPRSSGQ